MNRAILEKISEGLRQGIYAASWGGELWGPLGAIKLSKLRFQALKELGDEKGALSALSSTYYTAAGNARAKGRVGRAFWCAIQAMLLSDDLEEKYGLRNLTPDELDIRSRILFMVWRYRDSLRVSREALSRGISSPDTRALLEMGLAETLSALGKEIEATHAWARAIELATKVKPTTLVRVHRALAGHCFKIGDRERGHQELGMALRVAHENGLQDQIVKITALADRAEKKAGELKN